VGADDPAVYGDAAYGSGAFLDLLAGANIAAGCKTQPPTAAGGLFAKNRFVIDLGTDMVTCPGAVTVPIRRGHDGDGIAYFGQGCASCPLRAQCTTATSGRTVSVGRHEQRLADARAEQQQPEWQADYQGDPAESRTQARASDAPQARRPASPGPRKGQGRRRLQPAGRRRQPRSSDRARGALDRHWMGRRDRPERPGRKSCRFGSRPTPPGRPGERRSDPARKFFRGSQPRRRTPRISSQRDPGKRASPDARFTPAT